MRTIAAVLALLVVILVTPSVTAHGDTEAMQATVELGPGETVVWQRQVHWHRLMGTVDASGPVTVSIEGPDRDEAAIASGSSLRLDHLVACCRDTTWAIHIVHLTNPGDASVDADVDLALLHDNFAVIADDAEVGAWWQTLAIVGFMVGIPAWRARQPVTKSVRDWPLWGRGFHVGAWALALLVAAVGMARFRTGPLVGTVGATAWAPGDLGGFFNTHSLVMLALMAGWGTAYALWAGARRPFSPMPSFALPGPGRTCRQVPAHRIEAGAGLGVRFAGSTWRHPSGNGAPRRWLPPSPRFHGDRHPCKDGETMLSNSPVAANVAVSDLKRAQDFYNNKLGLTSVAGPTEHEMRFSCGNGTTLQVYEKPDVNPSENTCATFQVDDLESTMETLRSNGVEFEDYDLPGGLTTEGGVATMGAMKAAWFTDPDGNVLCIHQEPDA